MDMQQIEFQNRIKTFAQKLATKDYFESKKERNPVTPEPETPLFSLLKVKITNCNGMAGGTAQIIMNTPLKSLGIPPRLNFQG